MDEREAALEDAVASAAALMLRHRLFPRAMAWNVRHSVESGANETFPAPNETFQPANETFQAAHGGFPGDALGARTTLEDVARSFPLLQAGERHIAGPNASVSGGQRQNERREQLLRAVGKYLDPAAQSSQQQHHGQMQGALPVTINRVQEEDEHMAFQAMSISTHSDDEGGGRSARPSVQQWAAAEAQGLQGSGVAASQPQSPAESTPKGKTSSKKRTRGESTRRERERVDPETMIFPKTKTPIAPSLARALLTGYGAKRCSADECGKIAVSKGLCRGHGGGRRCQSQGCNKCAQSRSPYCWAHGGGKRCEAPNCRRSRKTKRFCVDHVEMEKTVPPRPSSAPSTPPRPSPASSPSASIVSATSIASAPLVAFPPLKRQMSNDFGAHATAGMDSDDSIGGRSTITTDSDVSSVYASSFGAGNKENAHRSNSSDQDRSARLKQHRSQPRYQDAGERTSAFSPAMAGFAGDLQAFGTQGSDSSLILGARSTALPSLSEALLRAVPSPPQTDPRFPPTSSSVYASFTSSTYFETTEDDASSAFPTHGRRW